MDSRWERIVGIAREVDEAFASGAFPSGATVMRLARSVLDFQQSLVTARVRPPSVPPPPDDSSTPSSVE
jgi:hypothetical protein